VATPYCARLLYEAAQVLLNPRQQMVVAKGVWAPGAQPARDASSHLSRSPGAWPWFCTGCGVDGVASFRWSKDRRRGSCVALKRQPGNTGKIAGRR